MAILKEFKTNKEIEVLTDGDVLKILRFCNPTMIRHYQQQMKYKTIVGFGKDIKLERVTSESVH